MEFSRPDAVFSKNIYVNIHTLIGTPAHCVDATQWVGSLHVLKVHTPLYVHSRVASNNQQNMCAEVSCQVGAVLCTARESTWGGERECHR
jgi:hypothetical protein